MRINNTNYNFITLLKSFILLFFLFSSFYVIYNIYHIEKFNQRYITRIQTVYSYVRRFGSYYNNASEEHKLKDDYQIDNVSIIINTPGKVKKLSKGISLLRSELDKLTNNVSAISVFENSTNNAHFCPIKPKHSNKLNNDAKNNPMHQIVVREGLINTYQSFYGCNLKLTKSYTDDCSDTQIRTIYYPIYNNKRLDALLAIDIKSKDFTDSLQQYNKKYLTVININHSNNFYTKQELLPCSKIHPMNMGFNLFSIFRVTFLPALLLSIIYGYFKIHLIKKRHNIQRDLMTHFYRRDFYEKKWLKQRKFNLLIIDIDHFKKINDNYGHEIGDEVIRHIAKRINNYIDPTDTAVRWGGEEFIINFQNISNKELHIKAKDLCSLIDSKPILSLNVTVSIGGISTTNSHFNDAYKLADKALYHSKNNGRNQYTIV
ncbi:GGDEF domain-containing protein [Photobacterium piscicola]|uniref:GGDEF domain-containing protein n=1 Tax=Photobacterium piscicola TaxID=1378299 RepID=UPI0038D0D19B